MGNSLEAPYEGAWDVIIEEKDFEIIKNAEFDFVRIPIRWSAYSNTSDPYTINSTFFNRVDEVITQSLDQGLTTIIDMHHFEELMANPEGEQDRFISMWEQIAIRYSSYSSSLYFELLNEPADQLQQNAAKVNELQNLAISKIRETNPDRKIIVGSNLFNSYLTLKFLDLPDDNNLIATIHYYLPLKFTHQGAEWVNGANEWVDVEWKGTETEMATIRADLDIAYDWSQETGVPVWLGEFGAIENADIESRARWTSFVAREAEKRNIAWSYWDFAARFAAYNKTTGTWNQDLLEALIPLEDPVPDVSYKEKVKIISDSNSPTDIMLLSINGYWTLLSGLFFIRTLDLIQKKRKRN